MAFNDEYDGVAIRVRCSRCDRVLTERDPDWGRVNGEPMCHECKMDVEELGMEEVEEDEM